MVLTSLRQRKAVIFPLMLLLLLIALTATKTSGSSVGVFNKLLYGSSGPGVVANQPRDIRSDEWEVNTPLTVSQVKNGLPRINKDIGNGQDMSVVVDVPYKEWSSLFKPQNWSFFVLPLEYAFAFKWWLLACSLMLATYLFCLEILPEKYLLSSLISVGVFLSPFVQWWYSSGALLCLAYGLLIAYIGLRLFDKSLSDKQLLWWSVLLAYILTCFGLIMYVPFILPITLVVAAFLFGHTLNLLADRLEHRFLRKRIAYAAGAAFVALCLCLTFIATRSSAINAIQGTVYPGNRVDKSGGFDFEVFSGGPYNLQLQDNNKAAGFPLNQSEASSFIYIFPFLLPAVIYFLLKKGRAGLDWRIIAILAVCLGFLVRLFVPFSEVIFNALRLNTIPHDRLVIGLGIANIVLVVLVFEKLQNFKRDLNPMIVRFSVATAFIYTLVVGMALRYSHPGYLGSVIKIIAVSAVIALIVFFILKKRLVLAMILLVLFSIVSSARINPLYKGLSPLVSSRLSNAIQAVDDRKGKWVVSEDVTLENVVAANGAHSLSGVYSYPQLDIWEPLGRKAEDKNIYNRYAHVFFTVEGVDSSIYPLGAYLDPPALDAFRVHADPCSGYLRNEGVSYILTSRDKSQYGCLKQIKAIPYPALTLRVYQIKP